MVSTFSSRIRPDSPPGARPDRTARASAAARTAAIGFALILLAADARAQKADSAKGKPTEYTIGVEKGGLRAKRVVILEPFTAEGSAPSELALEMGVVVSQDLRFSGIFEVAAPLRAGASMADSAARPAGECVISATLSGGSGLRLQALLTEPRSGRKIAERSYDLDASRARATAHRLSDEIVYILTGEQGIARTRLAFVGKTKDAQELYVVDYDGEGLTQVTRDKSIALSPSWSPDGEAILYTSYKRGTAGVYWTRPNASSGGAVSLEPGLNASPSWSHDGRRIALSLSKDGNSEIYALRRDGSGHVRLTANRAIDISPTWSPDGRQIAFTSDRTGSPQVFIMDSDGANPHRVTYEGDYNASPEWSPLDGRRIVYVSRTYGGFDLYVLDLSTGGTTPLTRGEKGIFEDPTWAPNARHVAASRQSGGRRSIVVMQADGSETRTVTPSSLDAFAPTWSPVLGDR